MENICHRFLITGLKYSNDIEFTIENVLLDANIFCSPRHCLLVMGLAYCIRPMRMRLNLSILNKIS